MEYLATTVSKPDPEAEAARAESIAQDKQNHEAFRKAHAEHVPFASDLAEYNENLLAELILIAFDYRKAWLPEEIFNGYRGKALWNLNHESKPLDQQTPTYKAAMRAGALNALRAMFEETISKIFGPDAERQHRIDIRSINQQLADQQAVVDPATDIKAHADEADHWHYKGDELTLIVEHYLQPNRGARLVMLKAATFIWRDAKGADHEEDRIGLRQFQPINLPLVNWLRGFPSEGAIKSMAAKEEADALRGRSVDVEPSAFDNGIAVVGLSNNGNSGTKFEFGARGRSF